MQYTPPMSKTAPCDTALVPDNLRHDGAEDRIEIAWGVLVDLQSFQVQVAGEQFHKALQRKRPQSVVPTITQSEVCQSANILLATKAVHHVLLNCYASTRSVGFQEGHKGFHCCADTFCPCNLPSKCLSLRYFVLGLQSKPCGRLDFPEFFLQHF